MRMMMRRTVMGGPGQILIERHLVWSKACDGISTEESWRGARDQQRVTTTGSVGANTVGATIIVQLGSGRGV